MYKKFLFSILIILGLIVLNVQLATAMGLGEWGHTTQYGTSFDGNDGPTSIKCKNGEIENVRIWYYYKNRIIGNCGTHNKVNSYFVLNEVGCQIQIFRDKKIWKEFLSKNNLEPLTWKRWYRAHDDVGLLILINGIVHFWYISLPAIFLFGWGIFKILTLLLNGFGLPLNLAGPILILVILIRIFFDNTVQSF